MVRRDLVWLQPVFRSDMSSLVTGPREDKDHEALRPDYCREVLHAPDGGLPNEQAAL